MLTPMTKIALPSRFVVFHFQFRYTLFLSHFSFTAFILLRHIATQTRSVSSLLLCEHKAWINFPHLLYI